MHITDLEGRKIEITNFAGSLALAKFFFTHTNQETLPSLQRLEDRRLHYWKDIYVKLIALAYRLNKSNTEL